MPDFSRLWQQVVPSQSPREQQLIVYGPTDELLGAWDLLNGTGNSAVIGSFPANPRKVMLRAREHRSRRRMSRH